MDAYDFVHLGMLAIGGGVRGKTKLQKTVYFLGKLTGQLPELGYRAHYYGPYSSAVAEGVDRLLSLGFLNEEVSSGGAVDPHGFEVARHDYALTEEGEKVAKLKARRNRRLWEALQKASGTFRKGGDPDYVKLSIAAKTDFMLGKRRGKASIDELAPLARTFGWTVRADQVRKAAQFLERIGLVTLADR